MAVDKLAADYPVVYFVLAALNLLLQLGDFIGPLGGRLCEDAEDNVSLGRRCCAP